ncbi:MAG: serine/threonine protein kinase [Myxococcales bacterium]|nr:serine/threonine protein kinase [Myxococcales bacterium]
MTGRGSGEDTQHSGRGRRSSFIRRARECSESAMLRQLDPEELMIVGRIAESDEGRVVHAYDTRARRHVALKQLFGPLSPITEARFLREAHLPARLSHPGIVEILGVGRWPGGDPFYVMELIHGIELSQLVAQARLLRERLPLLRHVCACAEAIGSAHRRRIIHRDLKPENVLISDRGQPVIIDWGLAKDLAEDDEPVADDAPPPSGHSGRTLAGHIVGTPSFMSPEQARGEAADPRSDVYAVGAILLHVLTGVLPYPGDDARQVVDQVIAGPPPALGLLSSSLRPELVAVVERALARAPDERYPDGDALAEALQGLTL